MATQSCSIRNQYVGVIKDRYYQQTVAETVNVIVSKKNSYTNQ